MTPAPMTPPAMTPAQTTLTAPNPGADDHGGPDFIVDDLTRAGPDYSTDAHGDASPDGVDADQAEVPARSSSHEVSGWSGLDWLVSGM